ncbi:hypothetical protein ACIQBJ_32045 [Kitasatospora sp. NPDC088391]|uniref:DUF7848 domain-containing protein n=1 Tax=Kitasatospora sp. NPDC088391 TaxID=3364074 RepID=UPI00382D0087
MGTTKTFRFRNYDIHPDPAGETTYAAECVSGDEADCGAQSGDEDEPTKVDTWIAKHVRDTGHQRFRRTVADYATAEPGAWQ